ncbi:MAG: glycosyltransferase family 2 protein [Bacteroidaceae bacterium]|nr:glycosyltransferase family 2 protein [Bacteroidaceae bacterium]
MGIKVSVIVPVYGVSDYIEQCVKSVMNQTYRDVECVIVDDATPDDSITQCEKLIAAYEGPVKFTIVHHERNRGLSAARNTGTDAATGDYVLYLDSDDEITQDCIEKLVVPVMRDASVEMVVGNYVNDYQGKRIARKQDEHDVGSYEAVRDFFFCKRGFYVNAWNKLVKRDLLVEHQVFFKEGYLWEDNLWTFFLLKYLNHVSLIQDVTYLHFKRPHSITLGTDREKKVYNWKRVYEEIANNFTPGEAGKEAKYFIRYIFFQIARNGKSEELYMICKPYLKALLNDHYYLEYLFGYGVVALSRTAWGRALLHDVAHRLH